MSEPIFKITWRDVINDWCSLNGKIYDENTMIIQNAFRVKETGEIFRSCHVHDYEEYRIYHGVKPDFIAFVDGGDAYFRSSGLDDPRIENLCLTTAHSKEEIRKKLLWGTRGKSGKEPFKWAVLNECTTEHLQAILRECKPSKIYRETIQGILNSRIRQDNYYEAKEGETHVRYEINGEKLIKESELISAQGLYSILEKELSLEKSINEQLRKERDGAMKAVFDVCSKELGKIARSFGMECKIIYGKANA